MVPQQDPKLDQRGSHQTSGVVGAMAEYDLDRRDPANDPILVRSAERLHADEDLALNNCPSLKFWPLEDHQHRLQLFLCTNLNYERFSLRTTDFRERFVRRHSRVVRLSFVAS